MMRDKASGFTLVEVMVVLTIFSLCSVLMLQMLTVFLRGYDQVNRIQSEYILDSMRESWFRDSLSVMVASHDAEFGFHGDRREISGITLHPLIGPGGRFTEASWEIRSSGRETALWYTESGYASLRIGTWTNTGLEFQYRGLSSGWVNEWPPRETPPGELPHRIKLIIDEADTSRELFAAVTIRRVERYDYRDLL